MIVYHHIGGRNGTYPMPIKNGPLLNDFHLVLYEPDVSCIDHIKKNVNDQFKKVTVLPYCIGGETGKSTFHINYHATTSSIYDFDVEYSEYNRLDPNYGEYRLGPACKTCDKREIQKLSLAEALKQSSTPDIDYLSLDVQGAEFEILYGARELLEKRCLGIQLEFNFNPMYVEKKCFSDINHLLIGLGFELLDIHSVHSYSKCSLPIGFRGREQLMYGEAIYCKKVNQSHNPNDLLKIALFSLLNKNIGHCVHILNSFSKKELELYSKNIQANYMPFLMEILELIKNKDNYKLPCLFELLSHEEINQLYRVGKKEDFITKKNAALSSYYLDKDLNDITSWLSTNETPFEAHLKKYGLKEIADLVKTNRNMDGKLFKQLFSKVELKIRKKSNLRGYSYLNFH